MRMRGDKPLSFTYLATIYHPERGEAGVLNIDFFYHKSCKKITDFEYPT